MIIQPQLRNNNTTGGRSWTSFNVSSFKTIVLMFRERKQLLCEFWIQSFLKMWRSVRKYLRLQRLNIKCNGLKCFAVLSSSSVPFVNCVGQLFLAFWLWSVTTNSTNVRVIYFLAVGWNERAWISTNTTFLLQTWIYLKSQATVGTTLPVIF